VLECASDVQVLEKRLLRHGYTELLGPQEAQQEGIIASNILQILVLGHPIPKLLQTLLPGAAILAQFPFGDLQ